ERSTRWLVGNEPGPLRIAEVAHRFEPGARLLSESLPRLLDQGGREAFDRTFSSLREAGVPERLASRVTAMRWLPATFDIVAVAFQRRADRAVAVDARRRQGVAKLRHDHAAGRPPRASGAGQLTETVRLIS